MVKLSISRSNLKNHHYSDRSETIIDDKTSDDHHFDKISEAIVDSSILSAKPMSA